MATTLKANSQPDPLYPDTAISIDAFAGPWESESDFEAWWVAEDGKWSEDAIPDGIVIRIKDASGNITLKKRSAGAWEEVGSGKTYTPSDGIVADDMNNNDTVKVDFADINAISTLTLESSNVVKLTVNINYALATKQTVFFLSVCDANGKEAPITVKEGIDAGFINSITVNGSYVYQDASGAKLRIPSGKSGSASAVFIDWGQDTAPKMIVNCSKTMNVSYSNPVGYEITYVLLKNGNVIEKIKDGEVIEGAPDDYVELH